MANVQVLRLNTPNVEEDDASKLKQMKPHVPGIVTFADHNRPLPWSVTYHSVVMFADISGFTSLCEKYSTMGQSGVDQLTRTLNEYLSSLVDGILGSDGDILKFAGDAILAIWRVGREEELPAEIVKVTQCCLDIQDKCGEYDTDIGVKLTVKIGVSAGVMTVTYLGNQEYRHYVELGPAVTAVNAAEHFCQSGYIVMSPDTFNHCDRRQFETETMEDGQHARIMAIVPLPRTRSNSMPVASLFTGSTFNRERRLSNESPLQPDILRLVPASQSDKSPLSTIMSNVLVPAVEVSGPELDDSRPSTPNEMKGLIKKKMNIGQKFGKLRKVVETVTEMKLDIALRLYILPPVLKKIDDDQPLEYLSEMRQVSIVFMNLVLDGNIDTEQLLQTIFEVVYTKAKAMHGSLNKVFLFDKGCTFLVIFGLPGFKHENDCAHALMCSGRMKSQLDKILGVERVSIGVTTGTTFCGVVGHPKRHEYSVIGRKVNMAARLMMHYPAKITCDTDTFQTARLPPTFFEVLVTKSMKGLVNVGIIREFVGYSKDEQMVAKRITRSNFPILGRQVEEFMFREQVGIMKNDDDNKRRHLIFSGPSGIGKTKLLDQILTIAQQKQFMLISCRVELEDSSYPYFVANHIIRTLLSNAGFTHQVDKEPYILEAIGEHDVKYMYLLNVVLGEDIKKPIALVGQNINDRLKRRLLLHRIAQACLDVASETVIVIDDAHNIDTSSWEFLCELLPINQALIVLGLRPSIIDTPTCKEALEFIDKDCTRLVDLSSLDNKFMAPLACQLMDVISIPKDLDRILRELSHGVPTWCLEILKDMLDKKQLIVVQDDGRAAYKQSSIAPNRLLIKPISSRDSLNITGSDTDSKITPVLNISATEIPRDPFESDFGHVFLSDLCFDEESGLDMESIPRGSNPITHLSAGGAMTMGGSLRKVCSPMNKVKKREKQKDERIAIFAKGIIAKDIPIPASMKELVISRLDSMRASDQVLVKCASVLGKTARRDILEMLLPKAHRLKLVRTIRRLIEAGIMQCGNIRAKQKSQVETGMQRYRCFCPKEDVQVRPGEPEVCFEPTFTNNLLQQTAYETLMESQRVELHSKAAHYFELSADELRNMVPYYVLNREPGENLQEKLRLIEDDEAFTPKSVKTPKNKVSDEMYAKAALQARARRGRRLGVAVSAEDAVPLVHRIVQEAQPLESMSHYLELLLPMYHSLCHHWTHSNQPWNVIYTLLEQTTAAVAIHKNAKGLDCLEKVKELLASLSPEGEMKEVDTQVMQAKIHRLHGKILYRAGNVSEGYERVLQAAAILDLPRPGKSTVRFTAKLLAQFLWYWKYRAKRNRPTSQRTLEQGYCLSDLYMMDKEIGDTQYKLIHALQQFTKVVGRVSHLHQVIVAYSSMIECCREKDWLSISDKLEAQLLHGCAARNDELSSEDRSIVAAIYTKSCILMFMAGDLKKADKTGKAAMEISSCIQDMDNIKSIVPYYFFICLMTSGFPSTIDLLHQLKFASQMTDDKNTRTMFHILCIEVALAGGCPPETIEDCFSYICKSLRCCDAVANEITARYYAAMTVALWCARTDQWTKCQVWFDYWEMYETNETSLFCMMARVNKLECMILSLGKCILISNTHVANNLKTQIIKDIKIAKQLCKQICVLEARVKHLEAFFHATSGSKCEATRLLTASLKSALKHENKFETSWIRHHMGQWNDKSSKSKNIDVNMNWKALTNAHYIEWKLMTRSDENKHMYTWSLPA